MKKLLKVLADIVAVLVVAIGACVLMGCEAPSSSEEESQIKYLAVQFEEGDNWSIIDAGGKVLVDREYAADNEISKITNSGVFWVKQGEKFQLFSIESPRRPLTDEEYDAVTAFADGVAFAYKKGEPILLINEKGKLVKQLGREIAEAHTFSDGMAIVEDQDGLRGYVNTKGEIVIKPQYEGGIYVQDFKDGFALVPNVKAMQKAEGYVFDIIDKQGNVTFSTKGTKYSSYGIENLGHGRFTDDTSYSANPRPSEVFDSKGEVILKLKKQDVNLLCYKDGRYLAYVVPNFKSGLVDEDGESVIRIGKYEDIRWMRDGVFAAKRGDKWGYVDKDDNALTDFEYDNVNGRFGKSYVVKQGSMNFLLDSDFKEIKNTEFYRAGGVDYSEVKFIDIAAIAEAIVKDLTPQGYKPFIGKMTAEEICKAAGVGIDEIDDYQYSLELPSYSAGKSDFSVTAYFTGRMKTMRYRTETVNDGWFSTERQIEDGMGWNSESEIKFFRFMDYDISEFNYDDLAEAVVKALEEKGFETKQRDIVTSLVAKNGGQSCLVEFINENGSLKMAIFPSFDEIEE